MLRTDMVHDDGNNKRAKMPKPCFQRPARYWCTYC